MEGILRLLNPVKKKVSLLSGQDGYSLGQTEFDLIECRLSWEGKEFYFDIIFLLCMNLPKLLLLLFLYQD